MSDEIYIQHLRVQVKADIEYYTDYRNRLTMYIIANNYRNKVERMDGEKLLLLLKELQLISIKISDLRKSIGEFD